MPAHVEFWKRTFNMLSLSTKPVMSLLTITLILLVFHLY